MDYALIQNDVGDYRRYRMDSGPGGPSLSNPEMNPAPKLPMSAVSPAAAAAIMNGSLPAPPALLTSCEASPSPIPTSGPISSPLVSSVTPNNSSSTQNGTGSGSGTPHTHSQSSRGGRVVIDWSEAETETLMCEYEKHRCLWDPAHPNYHCNNNRTQAYYSILEQLGAKFNITDIKKKINSIRTQFNQERNRIMKMGEQGRLTQREDTRYKYYDRLSFLAESVDIRKNQRSTTPKTSDEMQSENGSDNSKAANGLPSRCYEDEEASPSVADYFTNRSPDSPGGGLAASQWPLSIATGAGLADSRDPHSQIGISIQNVINSAAATNGALIGAAASYLSGGTLASSGGGLVTSESSPSSLNLSTNSSVAPQDLSLRHYQSTTSSAQSPASGHNFITPPMIKSELGSPTKTNKPTCAIIPEAATNRHRNFSPQGGTSTSSISSSYPTATALSMVPPRKRQKFAKMHGIGNSNGNSSTLHIPNNSTVNLQVNEARNTPVPEKKFLTADDSFGSYVAAELRTMSNHPIKNKLKLQIVSLIIQASNEDMIAGSSD